jgi:ATP-dependent Clp protease ATP-binding subunit ClpB
MNFNNYTIKSQEVIQRAVEIARGAGNQAIEPVHVLKAMMSEGDSVLKFIFQKLDVNPATIERTLNAELSHLPRVNGGEPYLSGDTSKALQSAADFAQRQGDQYVTLEALLMGLFTAHSPASAILKDAGMTQQQLVAAIAELRKGKRATEQGAENQYNALNKYAVNLNERARQGKLDPVIGRDD